MDQVQNFVKEIVSGTHVAADTTVNVVDASLFPDPASGQYNLTWWDATNYPDPSGSTGDPNREIVRVTARDTGLNTLTVTRAQEGTSASDKNTVGATYLLALTPTKKNQDDIANILKSASSSTPASIDLHEDTDNGTNKVTIIAPSSISSDKTLTLPDSTGTIAITGDIPVKASKAEVAAGSDDIKFVTSLAIEELLLMPEGGTKNIKFVPSVASNNLTIALKGLDGNDHSATNPGYVMIGGVLRTITTALSVTRNAGTNMFNAGSAELATKEIDYFVYLAYEADSNAIRIGFSRIPYAKNTDVFSASSTNEKFCDWNNTPDAGEAVVNIGRFAATLSAGAGYTWTVPTFTSSNLVQRPIYETRWLSFVSQLTWTAGTDPSGSPTVVNRYKLIDSALILNLINYGYTPGATVTSLTATLPFVSANYGQGTGQINITGTPNLTYVQFNGGANNATLNCTSVSANRFSFSASIEI